MEVVRLPTTKPIAGLGVSEEAGPRLYPLFPNLCYNKKTEEQYYMYI